MATDRAVLVPANVVREASMLLIKMVEGDGPTTFDRRRAPQIAEALDKTVDETAGIDARAIERIEAAATRAVSEFAKEVRAAQGVTPFQWGQLVNRIRNYAEMGVSSHRNGGCTR
jgi:hypothetical protein